MRRIIMKLVIAIVSNDDSHTVLSALTKANFSVTKLSSSGGFLRVGNTTLMIGTEAERLEELKDLLREYCSTRQLATVSMPASYSDAMFSMLPVEVTVGGAAVFVLDVEEFLKI